jgi:hypothetical protein
MTVVPAGPDPAALVTDDAVTAAIEARKQVLMRPPAVIFGDPGEAEKYLTRKMLEAASGPVVAAWQRWEEDQLDAKEPPAT